MKVTEKDAIIDKMEQEATAVQDKIIEKDAIIDKEEAVAELTGLHQAKQTD